MRTFEEREQHLGAAPINLPVPGSPFSIRTQPKCVRNPAEELTQVSRAPGRDGKAFAVTPEHSIRSPRKDGDTVRQRLRLELKRGRNGASCRLRELWDGSDHL